MNPTPRKRPTARILVLNNHDQVLLFEVFDTMTDVFHFWVTPGGGVEPGESFEDAARRELFEETGFVVSSVGKPVWWKRKVVRFGKELIEVEEFYFAVRVSSLEVVHDNPDEHERGTVRGHRWWTLEELQATSEMVFPEHFVEYLEPILRGKIPSEPIDISAEIVS